MSTSSLLADMFAGYGPAERAEKFERYKAALAQSIADADSGRFTYGEVAGVKKMRTSGASVKKMEQTLERVQEIQKGLTGDAAAQLQGDLDAAKAMLADIAKDWIVGTNGTSPNPSAQLVPYDLQRPVKELVPLHTPLRNQIPRNAQGEGLATHWKQLDSLNNSGVGTAGVLDPFFDSQQDTAQFGTLNLRRGKKINYATSDKTAAYIEMGYSDLVTSVAQYAGVGFQDMRQMSRHALTWTHLMGEERAILYGRGGTGNGYLGTVGAPTGVTAVAGSGGSLAAGTVYVKVVAVGGFGGAPSAEANVTVTANQKVTVSWTEPPVAQGALSYDVYAGTAAGAETFQTHVVGATTVDLLSLSTGGAAVPASDSSFSSKGYDGFLSILPSAGGYVKRQNGKWSAANPGSELQTAFQSMYDNNFAEPNEVWLDSNVKVALGNALQTNAQNLPFRIQLNQEHGVIGTAVTGVQNILNSQMVPLNVHPFMPKGAVMLRSTHLPYPAQGITATSEVRTVQDYMAIDWPVIQHTYDSSTYFFGTLIHYAPAFSGIFLGVQGVA